MLAAIPLLLGINLLTAGAVVLDKRQAINGEWRIAESTLLGMAALGGSIGAVWARRTFRHKTRKQPFSTLLDVIAMLHVGIAIGLVSLLF
jgi:uncharacterized membrane protein YsdA (DUF1294 family)